MTITTEIYIAIALVVLAVLAILVIFTIKKKKQKKLSPLAMFAIFLVVLGIIFADDRLISYSFLGAGLLLSVINLIIFFKKK